MGQSPSAALDRENSLSDRFSFLSSSGFISSEEFPDEIATNRDYTSEIPDECLAYVFQFLGPGDRNRCSLVCKRWLCVDGWSRHRLSLNAQSEIDVSLPSLFTRFDSVTKLALRCSRKSISLTDDALVTISIYCKNLTRLKLRGCREITDEGMSAFAENSKNLRKLSCGSCMFGAKALNAVLDYCKNLEELSVKRLRGIHDGADPIGPGAAASTLKMICLKELVNGQSFEPLVIGSKSLKTLKIIHCLGDWDRVLQLIGNRNGKENLNFNNNNNSSSNSLMEIHLERLQVSDIGLSAISKCTKIENLHILKTPECSNYGLVCVAEQCKLLRKLHVDGWRTNRIGDEGLVALAKHCPNLQELVLIGVNATHLSLAAIACNCSKLERLALCGSGTIGDAEIACIAAKCMALKKLCIKGCPISDVAIEALGCGCPSLMKIKVRKCKGVSSQAGEWLREQRASMVINMDACEIDGGSKASVSDGGVHDIGVEFHQQEVGQVIGADASTSSNGSLALLRSKLGLFAGRNLVAFTFRRWSNNDDSFNSNL
ncbi:F-box protein SKIP2-like [Durio zibethinus]|uniref:F-box protein SKIP2-like n=1 Tax=Durio zibethinus TaxID=66656 RepID=A0A6P6BDI7_DURZI|nr:F-box protein SKIP2-like [Durio zibethinus]